MKSIYIYIFIVVVCFKFMYFTVSRVDNGGGTPAPTPSPTPGPTGPPPEGYQRTVIFLRLGTSVGQNVFIRGGISHDVRPGKYALILIQIAW